MNYNLLAYTLFFGMTTYIIIVVGQICYRNGNVYVLSLLPGHEDLCIRINKLLLLGYYLVNLGYVATTLISWQAISSFQQMVELLAFRTSVIILLLSALHYLNLFIITNYVKKLIQ